MNQENANFLFNNKELFNNGKRGIVYTSELNGKKYLIKTRKQESTSPGTVKNEYFYNKKVNELGVGPKIYYYDEEQDFLIRDFVNGLKLEDWIEENKNNPRFKIEIKNVLLKILEQARLVDEKGINKQELTNPHKDILITNNEPVIIDFERCRYTNKPKNVTQFLQYLTRPAMSKVLERQSIKLDKQIIIELGEEYKKNYEKEVFEKIKKVISS